MIFAQISEGSVTQYPLSFADIQRMVPSVSFSQAPTSSELEAHGFARVRPAPTPDVPLGYTIRDDGPVERQGLWMQAFQIVPLPMDVARLAFRSKVADLRWQRETGGIVIQGAPIRTDRESQAMLSGATLSAQLDPALPIKWKGADGVFRVLDAETILAIARAVLAHVQACFDREAELVEIIDAAETHDALLAIDIEAGWPGAQA